jgi:hypothetical protein
MQYHVKNTAQTWRKLLCMVPKLAGIFFVSNTGCQASFLLQLIPGTLISYQLVLVFVISSGSVLCVVLRQNQIVLILFLRQQLEFDIVNGTVISKKK